MCHVSHKNIFFEFCNVQHAIGFHVNYVIDKQKHYLNESLGGILFRA